MKLFRWKQQREEELDAEIRSHLDEAIRDRIERGETSDEARVNALREFGNVGLVKEVTREMWGWASLERLGQDLRFGLRMLRKNPGFSLIAILTLALGIGVNTTIFSALEAVILHPFAFPNQERLFVIYQRNPSAGVKRSGVTLGDLHDWRAQSQIFAEFVSLHGAAFDLTGADTSERLWGYRVSAEFFAVLGVRPLLGHTFQPGEDMAGREQVIVLQYDLWQRRFGADPNIVGQSITLNGKAHTIIGVMPQEFKFPYSGRDLWVPYVFPADGAQDRKTQLFQVLGLLKPGVSRAQGEAELRAMSLRAQQQYPATHSGVEAFIVSLNEDYTRGARGYMPFTLGAVAFVLLIACANVANLLLARGATRQKELAVRLALGASRGRVVRQLLTESIVLALLGGTLGLGFAVWGVTALAKGLPPDFAPGWEHLGINTWALGFTLLASLLTGLLCGWLPAWQATKADVNKTLKDGGQGVARGARHWWLSALVVAEVALSLVLLVGAGLLVRSLILLVNADLGFNPDNTLLTRIILPAERYTQDEQVINFYQELEQRVAALPGVSAVGAADNVPPGNGPQENFQVVGQPAASKSAQPRAGLLVATPGYFAAAGTPLRAGRLFTAKDDAKTARVALVNEAFARRYFAGGSALGQRLRFADGPPHEIVGIVANVMNWDLTDAAEPGVYVPFTQRANRNMALFVRGQANSSEPENVTQVAGALQRELAAMDSGLPFGGSTTLRGFLRGLLSPKRLITALLSLFAALALVMATVGLYAVMSFVVAQRTHEIGIRMTLGAQTRDLLRLVLGQGLKLTLLGVGIGLAAAFGLTRLMANLLFGVTATNPLTFAGIALLLTLVALLACWIPAHHATKVDPLVALRHE